MYETRGLKWTSPGARQIHILAVAGSGEDLVKPAVSDFKICSGSATSHQSVSSPPFMAFRGCLGLIPRGESAPAKAQRLNHARPG